MQFRRILATFTVFVCLASAAKRPIAHTDYDSWRSISGHALSPNGRYLAYAVFPQEGDGEVVIRDLQSGKEWREAAGQLPPPMPPDPNSEAPPRPRTVRFSFTADSKTLAFLTFAKKADVDRAKKERPRAATAAATATGQPSRAEQLPGDLVIVDLASARASRAAQVKSFQLVEKTGEYVAYLKDGGSAAPRSALGTDLVLRKVADQSERTFPDVLEYNLTKDGASLVYAVASAKEDTDGVFVAPTAGGNARALASGKGKYEKIAWNDKQTELAFVSDHESGKQFDLYLWDGKAAKAARVVSSSSPGFREGFVISDKANLTFSKDGTRLFFGAAPPAPMERRGPPSDDEPSFDLWHYKDDHIQPMQKVRAAADRARSFRAMYSLTAHKMVQLADAEMFDLAPNESGKWALGTDDREYRPMVEYGEHFADTYLVDVDTGSRKLLAKKHTGNVTWSPDGKYALTFDGKDWSTIAVPAGKTTNLTAPLGVKFWTEDNDTPGLPRPYGLAGWTKDGKYVLVYDHYDLWQIAPDGSSAANVTDGFGRKEHLELRVVRTDTPEDTPAAGVRGGGAGLAGGEARPIDSTKPLLLRAENTISRDTGFYTDRIDGKEPPQKLMMDGRDFSLPMKAKDADVYVMTEQTFNQFPDLWVTDGSMKDLRRVSDVNPQKETLLWGSAEMVEFKNLDGVPLEGVLYKPENFDPKKKYPMIVYLYEKLSQNINHFVDPKPGHSMNITYYVSNGYLVFTPDIVYTIGHPGQSALKCVLAGVDAIAARGFVDEANIGIQGHSWGGYQIAYMVTQTTRFKAASPGAPVSDMISAYDGIRWGPGLPRQFQYEKTQSRIGGTLWEDPLLYIENSPIFMADRVKTPLLMLHNDADDAVPWYQGIEFYLALRRLGKEVYFFSYNGEPHHLNRRPNQKDYTVRMQEFFDYELKGAPKPGWMEHGIPYLERTRAKTTTDQ